MRPQEERGALLERIATLESDAEDNADELCQSRKQYDAMRAEASAASEELKRSRAELDEARAAVEDTAATTTELQIAAGTLAEQVLDLTKQQIQADVAMKRAKAQLRRAVDEVTELRVRSSSDSAAAARAGEMVAEEDRRIAALEEVLAQRDSELATARQAVSLAESRRMAIVELEAKLAAEARQAEAIAEASLSRTDGAVAFDSVITDSNAAALRVTTGNGATGTAKGPSGNSRPKAHGPSKNGKVKLAASAGVSIDDQK